MHTSFRIHEPIRTPKTMNSPRYFIADVVLTFVSAGTSQPTTTAPQTAESLSNKCSAASNLDNRNFQHEIFLQRQKKYACASASSDFFICSLQFPAKVDEEVEVVSLVSPNDYHPTAHQSTPNVYFE